MKRMKKIIALAAIACLPWANAYSQTQAQKEIQLHNVQFSILNNVMLQKWINEKVKELEKKEDAELLKLFDNLFVIDKYVGCDNGKFSLTTFSKTFILKEFYEYCFDGRGVASSASEAAQFRQNRYGYKKQYWAMVDAVDLSLKEVEWSIFGKVLSFKNANFGSYAVRVSEGDPTEGVVFFDTHVKCTITPQTVAALEKMRKERDQKTLDKVNKEREKERQKAVEKNSKILQDILSFAAFQHFYSIAQSADFRLDTTVSNEKMLLDILKDNIQVKFFSDSYGRNEHWDEEGKYYKYSRFAAFIKDKRKRDMFSISEQYDIRYDNAKKELVVDNLKVDGNNKVAFYTYGKGDCSGVRFSLQYSENTETLLLKELSLCENHSYYKEYFKETAMLDYEFAFSPKKMYKSWTEPMQKAKQEEAEKAEKAEEEFLKWEEQTVQRKLNGSYETLNKFGATNQIHLVQIDDNKVNYYTDEREKGYDRKPKNWYKVTPPKIIPAIFNQPEQIIEPAKLIERIGLDPAAEEKFLKWEEATVQKILDSDEWNYFVVDSKKSSSKVKIVQLNLPNDYAEMPKEFQNRLKSWYKVEVKTNKKPAKIVGRIG
jgi:hypothetical protein